MPIYPFACTQCGAEFDVERSAEDAARAVACPLDAAVARRVYGVVPAGSRAARPQAVPFGTYWHDHGPGTEPHLHGAGLPAD